MDDQNNKNNTNDDDNFTINELNEQDLKNKFSEEFKNCCEYFTYVEEMSNEFDITEEEAEEIFTIILSDIMVLMYEGRQEIVDGIKFYKEIFERIKKIKNYHDIIDVLKFQFVDNINSPHQQPIYNMVIFCLKITTHLIWKLCYKLAPRLHPTPEGAIQDILEPVKASHREIKKIMLMLEKKYNVKIINY
jgi:hypothetical protein